MVNLLLISFMMIASGQSAKKVDTTRCQVKLNVSADVMSQYVWRGTDYGNSPSIQPLLSLSAGNFEIGAWGAYAISGAYRELDLFAKYTVKNLSVSVTDYYVPGTNDQPMSPDPRFSVYNNATTAHTIEGALQYKRTGKIPLWVMGSVFFYGNDKRWGYDAARDTTNKTYYSSYFEAGYSFKVKKNSADVFLGFTPTAGAYGNTMGVINAGITAYRSITITDHFDLPLRASLIVNPQTSKVYFVVGFTL